MQQDKCFCIYYYVETNTEANVKLLAICTLYDKCIQIISENFTNFTPYINNTIMCKNNKNISCVLWVNLHKTNEKISDTGVTSYQPSNSIYIIDQLH